MLWIYLYIYYIIITIYPSTFYYANFVYLFNECSWLKNNLDLPKLNLKCNSSFFVFVYIKHLTICGLYFMTATKFGVSCQIYFAELQSD